MKRNCVKTAVVFFVALSICLLGLTEPVSANENSALSRTGTNAYTISVKQVTADEIYTIAVVSGTLRDYEVNAESIRYMTQQEANKAGLSVNFSLTPKEECVVLLSVSEQELQSAQVVGLLCADGTVSEHCYTAETTPAQGIKPGKTVYTCSHCEDVVEREIPGVPVQSFNDVSAQAWYYPGVQYVYRHGLFLGTSKQYFEPDTSMTRAMLVTILYRMAGMPECTTEVSFTDVEEGQWYYSAVCWGSETGIVNGWNDRFDPNGTLTRENLATILFRYAAYIGSESSIQPQLQNFFDGAQVSEWAQEAMNWAVSGGLITGTMQKGQLRLAPHVGASRAQVAMILMRSAELLELGE